MQRCGVRPSSTTRGSLRRDLGVRPGAALGHSANCLKQRVGRVVLEKDPGYSELPRNSNVKGAHPGGDHQNLAFVSGCRCGRDESSANVILKIKVQKHNIDGKPGKGVECVTRCSALCHSLEF